MAFCIFYAFADHKTICEYPVAEVQTAQIGLEQHEGTPDEKFQKSLASLTNAIGVWCQSEKLDVPMIGTKFKHVYRIDNVDPIELLDQKLLKHGLAVIIELRDEKTPIVRTHFSYDAPGDCNIQPFSASITLPTRTISLTQRRYEANKVFITHFVCEFGESFIEYQAESNKTALYRIREFEVSKADEYITEAMKFVDLLCAQRHVQLAPADGFETYFA